MNTLPQMLDFTLRVIVLVFALTIGVMFIFIGSANAFAANLKTSATVSGNVFTVGDIFSGLPQETADKVLGASPLPGHDMVLNARTLMRVAEALELPWQPASSADQVVVRRSATLIDTDMIKDSVSEELKEKGLTGNFEISFLGTETPSMVLPSGETPTIEIADMNYDAPHGRFDVTLMAPSKANAMTELKLAGKIDTLVSVPVLKKPLSSGTMIDNYDLEWIDIKTSSLQNDTVLTEEGMVGMTPRRTLDAGKPVRANELERPMLVARGDTILISYQNGPMNLTAQGKAMENGAHGDLIRVVNTSSNRTIDAFVENEHEVTVMP